MCPSTASKNIDMEDYYAHFRKIRAGLDDIQEAFPGVKLPLLCASDAKRMDIARHYSGCVDGIRVACPAHIDGTLHAMHHPMPTHRQPAFAGRIGGADALPGTERPRESIPPPPVHPEPPPNTWIARDCGALSQWSALK